MNAMDGDFPTIHEQQLIEAFANLKSEREVKAFLRDVFSRSEIQEAAKRFEIARQLFFTTKPYAQIAKDLKTSTATVTRTNTWLKRKGMEGFKTALKNTFPDLDPADR